jgi:glucosamine--fructose-6-phosphate aminotransferase (isomerizing)
VIQAERTRLFEEAAEAPHVIRKQLQVNRQCMEELGSALRDLAPPAVVTCGRGSSDHAATFARYLIETRMGLMTSSASPSVSSVYAMQPGWNGVAFLAISQSGASPDILSAAAAAQASGAKVIAAVNSESSPLARAAHHTIPLCAGNESSVAATKSHLASLAAVINLVASWLRDAKLLAHLHCAPAQLTEAWNLDWSTAATQLEGAESLYVIGRGLGFGAAQEAALKLKETCGLHAEAFSAAELRHGPMALVRPGFPMLVLSQNDETRVGISALVDELVDSGATVITAGAQHPRALNLPTVQADPVIEPMLMLQSFYRMVNALAVARGRDPDRPPHLNKITETL